MPCKGRFFDMCHIRVAHLFFRCSCIHNYTNLLKYLSCIHVYRGTIISFPQVWPFRLYAEIKLGLSRAYRTHRLIIREHRAATTSAPASTSIESTMFLCCIRLSQNVRVDHSARAQSGHQIIPAFRNKCLIEAYELGRILGECLPGDQQQHQAAKQDENSKQYQFF